MPLDLPRIAAALNAYPWTTGTLTYRADEASRASYCALGALLRYAGVAQEHIACAQEAGDPAVWELYGVLLREEYGIPDQTTTHLIMGANDGAFSHEEAVARVMRSLARVQRQESAVSAGARAEALPDGAVR